MSNHAIQDPFTILCTKRFSSRNFDPSKPISEKDLHTILFAGSLTPSSYNGQPWHFLVCSRFTHEESFFLLLYTLKESNQIWAKHAPLLILTMAANLYKNQPNRWAQYDTGAAAYAMMLQATSLGLMGHQMGGFDPLKAASAFKIPQEYTLMSVMAIGYLLPTEKLPERVRDPLSSHVHFGSL